MPPKVNKIEAEIRSLSKLEGNKTCADCPEKVPGYVDLTHNVFVCTKCSGIHREFQFKVKGVSMSVFSQEDVDALASMGNEKFNSIYLANLNPRDYTVPNGNDLNKLKDFIRLKYVERRWHRDGRGGSGGAGSYSTQDSSSASQAPASKEDSNRISLKLNTTGKSASTVSRRASTGSVEVSKKPASNDLVNNMDLLSISENNQSSFDPFSNSKAGSSNSHDPFASSSDGFGHSSNDPFAVSSNNQHAASFDAFGGPSNTSHAADPFDPFSTTKSQSQPQHGFDAFSAPANNQQSFDPFGAPSHSSGLDPFASSSQPAAPMPFIKVNPPAAVTNPPPTAPAPAVAQPPKKDFGAFDDLLTPAANLPVANPHSNNPFDSHFASAGNVPAAVPPNHGYPTQPVYPSAPYGAYPQAPAGYPQAYDPSYAAYYNNQAYPPAQPGYPGYPPNSYAQPYPPQQPIQHIQTQAPPQPAAAPANPPAPDPFAAMSSLAWTAVGASAPSAQQAKKPNPNPGFPSPTPSYSTQPPQISAPPANQQSVNPFDLF